MNRRIGTVAIVAGWLAVVQPLFAQSATGQFEVASIKEHNSDTGNLRGGFCHGAGSNLTITTVTGVSSGSSQSPIAPGSCKFSRTTLREIIAAAHGIPRRDLERLVLGGPSWVTT